MARLRWLPISLLLIFQAAALIYEVRHVGLTIDEPSHFAAAFAYWLGEDVLEPSDTPPLTRAISGWVPRILGVPDPRRGKSWQSGDAYLVGVESLNNSKIRARRVLFYTRLVFIVFPLGIVWLVWMWARQLFSESTAITLATFAAFEPTLLGHGAIIKSDVPASFFALLIAYKAWHYLENPSLGNMLWLTLVSSLGVVTKFTLLPLLPLSIALVLWKGGRFRAILIPFFVYATIIAISQFQANPIVPIDRARFPGAGVPKWAMGLADLAPWIPWPRQFIKGLIYIGSSMQGQGFAGFMLGRRTLAWEPSYYPLCFAIKFPISLQILTLAGIVISMIRLRNKNTTSAEAAIWGSAIIFIGSAIYSNFHIGFRHVIPAIPFLILGSGFAVDRCWRRGPSKMVVVIFLTFFAISSLRTFPNGISYFNEWIGGSSEGWHYLSDSNIDWGQNYPELAAFVRNHPLEPIHAILFSFDNIKNYTEDGSFISPAWPSESSPASAYRPSKGLYAISVNALNGLILPVNHQDYFSAFRNKRPIARLGYSILVYRIP